MYFGTYNMYFSIHFYLTHLRPSILQLFVYLEVTPSIASILQLKRRRIKRAIFVGSVPWTLVTKWIQTPRITLSNFERLIYIETYNNYITYMLLHIICIFIQDIVCFQEIF